MKASPPLNQLTRHSFLSDLLAQITENCREILHADRAILLSFQELYRENPTYSHLKPIYASNYNLGQFYDKDLYIQVLAQVSMQIKKLVNSEGGSVQTKYKLFRSQFNPDYASFLVLPIELSRIPEVDSYLKLSDYKNLIGSTSKSFFLGFIYLDKKVKHPDFFTSEKVKLGLQFLKTAKREILLSIKYADLSHQFEMEKSKTRYLELAQSVFLALSSTLDVENLCEKILDSVIMVMNAQRGAIFLIDDENEPRCMMARKKDCESLYPESLNYSHTVAKEVIKTQKPKFVVNAQSDHRLSAKTSIINLNLQMIICSPMIVKEKLLGVMYLDSQYIADEHAETVVDFFGVLATTAGIAIENARLYQDALEKQRMSQEMENLKLLDQRKTEFMWMVAHELKTPLNIISQYIDILKETAHSEPKQLDQFLPIIKEQSLQMSDMINQLLDIFRIRSGIQELDKRELRLDECLNQVLESFMPMAAKRGIELFNHVPENLIIRADWDLMIQLGMNLIGNAIKYSPNDTKVILSGESVTATQLANENRFVRITVADKGVGIPEDKFDRIFEVFYRIKSKGQEHITGSGLGLAIAKSIVDAHGGRIWVSSVPGKGSQFHFELPIT